MNWRADGRGRKAYSLDPSVFDRLSNDDRRMIDTAVAAGRVQVIPRRHSSEVINPLVGKGAAAKKARSERRVAHMQAMKAVMQEHGDR